jgi:hypothetical protein
MLLEIWNSTKQASTFKSFYCTVFLQTQKRLRKSCFFLALKNEKKGSVFNGWKRQISVLEDLFYFKRGKITFSTYGEDKQLL